MDFADQMLVLAGRIPKQTQHLNTEAATSTALVMPFISALGYNVFDPTEVVPEFTADVGIKKGEKVDYAIKRDDKPIILFEVKCWNVDLGAVHASQLYRYFSVTEARFGVLTNGIQYRFFTDLEEPNKMDERPFLEFDMLDLKPPVLDALKQFTRASFDMGQLISAAGELKYTKGIVKAIAEEYQNPSEEFVRYFAKRVYSGLLTKFAREQFADIVRRAFHQFINDTINERLKSALGKENSTAPQATAQPPEAAKPQLPPGVVAIDGDIETTQEEIDAFNIVRAIMAAVVEPQRVTMRDSKTYCSVLLDDNNRRPICRFWFGTKQKYIGVFDAEKKEERIPISSPVDIYSVASRLTSVVQLYQKPALVEA